VTRRTVFCPACRQHVAVSRWTGRVLLHVGRAIGDAVFCDRLGDKVRGGAS
jgi:hypothetical protein